MKAFNLKTTDSIFQLKKRSIQSVIRNLVNKSGINPNITTHSFRRSFATFHHRRGI